MLSFLLASLIAQAPAAAPTADDLVKRLDASPELRDKDKPFEINVSLARLYLGQGRYKEAAAFFNQAVAKAEPVRAAYLRLRTRNSPLTGVVTPGCEVSPAHDMEMLFKTANEKLVAKKSADALSCLGAALTPLPEVDVLLGHSQFLAGDTAAAIATYSRSLETFENNHDARYSRAAALLDSKGDDLASLKAAKDDLSQFLKDAPTSQKAREATVFLERAVAAIAAGGTSKLVPAKPPERAPPMQGQPPVLTKEMVDAFANTERTPELQAKFAVALETAEAALAKGEFQTALDNYKQVMPYQPENPRVRAGMAWSLFKLGKPMAERVWSIATQDPESVVALGDALKKQGNEAEAQAVWKRLAESVPSYADKLRQR